MSRSSRNCERTVRAVEQHDPSPATDPDWRALARRLRWPLPALVIWALAWGLCKALGAADLPVVTAVLAATALGAALALMEATAWRRAIIALGFPLSWGLQRLLHGTASTPSIAAGDWPAWAWLLGLGLLALAYPLRAWRDAPFFPTPVDALADLPSVVNLPPQASVLDAGCGLGHGLRALRRSWPQARLAGIEWSWPLWLGSWLSCPWARVRRADMWSASWREHDVVYLFQRPESMPRAVDKALREMRPGSWLVSLEFKAEGLRLHAVLQREGSRPVWVYQLAAAATARATP